MPDLCRQLSGKRGVVHGVPETSGAGNRVCDSRGAAVWRWGPDRQTQWSLADKFDLWRLPATGTDGRAFRALIGTGFLPVPKRQRGQNNILSPLHYVLPEMPVRQVYGCGGGGASLPANWILAASWQRGGETAWRPPHAGQLKTKLVSVKLAPYPCQIVAKPPPGQAWSRRAPPCAWQTNSTSSLPSAKGPALLP